MSGALLSGLSGLRVNQQYLDIIGNNIANANTPGYKVQRINFRDILSQTLRPGSGPTGQRGGTNPTQLGRGVSVGSVDPNMLQGSILNTGRALDLAIQGQGFFVLSDGTQNLFSRAGNFTQDAQNFIVDGATGFRVQSKSGQDIQIDRNSISPPQATGLVDFSGNLTAQVTGPLAEILQTAQAFEEHTSASITSQTEPAGGFVFANNETLTIAVDRGVQQTVNIPAGTYTAAQLATQISSGLTGATAVANGNTVVLTSDQAGLSSVLLVQPGTAASAIFQAADIGIDVVGTENPAALTTDLNNLATNTADYVPGSTILISGSRPDGTSVSSVFTYGASNDGTTLQNLLDHMATIFDVQPGGAFYTFDATTGNVSWTAYDAGAANFTITVRDDPNNPLAGSSNWTNVAYDPLVVGTDPDTDTLTSIVHDGTGQAHVVTFTFERQVDGTWNLTPSVDSSEGSILSPPITGIAFASDGTLLAVPSDQLVVQWAGVAGQQSIDMNLGTAGNEGGVTQFGAEQSSVQGTADGFPAGVLQSFEVRSDGLVQGFFSNGQITDLDTLALATFANPEGLKAVGNNMWTQSSNSGQAQIGAPEEGAAGSLVSHAQEGSNVDIAEEFVNLIQAQRSFQASARVITTMDQVLADLVRIV